jgi:hypothetical protein
VDEVELKTLSFQSSRWKLTKIDWIRGYFNSGSITVSEPVPNTGG